MHNMLRLAPRRIERACNRRIKPSQGRQQFLRSHTRNITSQSSSIHLPLSTELPSDSFQLLTSSQKAVPAEEQLYEQQVQNVQRWWKSKRYNDIKRPYSAEDVVSKRGSLQQTYPSSLMARKLFNLLQEKAKAGEPIHTSKDVMRWT